MHGYAFLGSARPPCFSGILGEELRRPIGEKSSVRLPPEVRVVVEIPRYLTPPCVERGGTRYGTRADSCIPHSGLASISGMSRTPIPDKIPDRSRHVRGGTLDRNAENTETFPLKVAGR